MKRREFIAAIGAISTWPIAGIAQQPARLRQIGSLFTDPQFRDALVPELQKLGWIEGRNVHFEERFHLGHADRMRTYAIELVKLSPDLILATSPVEAKVLRQETSIIPIVFVVGVDPVGQGIVDSFAHPGGNITGCSSFEFSMGGKWVQSLKELAPDIRRIAVLFNPETAPYMQSIVHSIEFAAGAMQVEISAIPVRDLGELAQAVASFAQEPNSAAIFPPDIFLAANIDAIIGVVAQHRLPTVYSVPTYAQLGGLLAYGPHLADNWPRAASLVDRILKGAKPADLPIEQPNKFELVINLKVAKALGLTVPTSLLASADEVIE